MAKVFGYAGLYRGYLIVIPPVVISEDYSEAKLYLPTFDKLKIPPIEEVLKLITYLKLFPSLDQYQIADNLEKAIENQNHFALIAKGRPMEPSFDDYVISTIKLEKSVGKLKDDGTMDYKDRGAIKEVFEGDIVGEFFKGYQGKEGFNVYGQRVPVVHELRGPAPGKNLYVDPENQNIVRSLINGFLEISQNILDVNETLLINRDIDYETGNIEFSGNIEIKGKVTDGFSVTSFGNLKIHGIVEGANLFARNNMTLLSGVLSKEGYKIECLGNFYARYIQNANLIVKKNIEVEDFIYHSHVRSNGEIVVTKKSGVILGGVTTALRKIEINIAGNKSGTPTELVCGVDQELDEKIHAKKKDLARLEEGKRILNEKIKQSFPAVFLRNPANYIRTLPDDKKNSAMQVIEKLKNLNDWIAKVQAEIEKLEKIGDSYNFEPVIKILQTKYDGVKERIVHFGKPME
jgi:uncharacterized protein (DUF342 family)